MSGEEIAIMIFGGMHAEVMGRGFNSQADIVAAIAGHGLSLTSFDEQEMCAKLEQPFVPNIWGQGLIINAVSQFNDLFYAYSLLPGSPSPTDILSNWETMHGDWQAYVTNALQTLNPEQQFNPTPPARRTLWDVIEVAGCPTNPKCAITLEKPGIQIGPDGTVTW